MFPISRLLLAWQRAGRSNSSAKTLCRINHSCDSFFVTSGGDAFVELRTNTGPAFHRRTCVCRHVLLLISLGIMRGPGPRLTRPTSAVWWYDFLCSSLLFHHGCAWKCVASGGWRNKQVINYTGRNVFIKLIKNCDLSVFLLVRFQKTVVVSLLEKKMQSFFCLF